MNGLLFGLADGIVAGRATRPDGAFAWLGCLGLAVLVYGAFWAAAMLLAAPLAHPLLRSRGLHGRFGFFLTLAFGLGTFLELYWWTRPHVFSGLSAFDPRR